MAHLKTNPLAAEQAEHLARGLSRTSTSNTFQIEPGESDRQVYLDAAMACLPRLIQVLDAVGPIDLAQLHRKQRVPSAVQLNRRISAALAVGLLADVGPSSSVDSLRGYARTALVEWQMTLGIDGYPANRRLRKSLLHATIAGKVARLLDESSGFEIESILDDLARHAWWIAKRPAMPPWLEAAGVCMMADTGVLVRDQKLLEMGRSRLSKLLLRQEEEGWFPERGGADVGRTTLAIDELGRLLCQFGWDEVADPLRRMLSFVCTVAGHDGSASSAISACGTGFISPYGIEMLAGRFPEAASLAWDCRNHWRDFPLMRLPAWHDDLCVLMAGKFVQAYGAYQEDLPLLDAAEDQKLEDTHLLNAGLHIKTSKKCRVSVSSRRGGAFRASWPESGRCIEDAGVLVVFPHRLRLTGRHSMRTTADVNAGSLTVCGALRPLWPDQPRPSKFLRALLRGWRSFQSMIARRLPGRMPVDLRGKINSLTHDTFERDVTLEGDRLTIRDRIHCRLRCQNIVLFPSLPARFLKFADRSVREVEGISPISLDGGRHVEIRRVYENGKLCDMDVTSLPPATRGDGRRSNSSA